MATKGCFSKRGILLGTCTNAGNDHISIPDVYNCLCFRDNTKSLYFTGFFFFSSIFHSTKEDRSYQPKIFNNKFFSQRQRFKKLIILYRDASSLIWGEGKQGNIKVYRDISRTYLLVSQQHPPKRYHRLGHRTHCTVSPEPAQFARGQAPRESSGRTETF